MPNLNHLKIIARNSPLSIIQVKELMSNFSNLSYDLLPVLSYGDKNKHIQLNEQISTDFFSRELDEAILKGEADIAIHSAKDLPYPLPIGLQLFMLSEGLDASDSIITKNNLDPCLLPKPVRIGSSSKNRSEYIRELIPDAEITPIRGTIHERIQLIEDGKIDVLIVATCALMRLGLENLIYKKLNYPTHPLQGKLAVIAKENRYDLFSLFAKLNHTSKYGKVTLCGFGPGNPDLLTVKALKAIQNADTIFYDDLIDQYYIQQFNAEKIYVGKRKNKHQYSQDEINEMLYLSAISGKNSIRLKGGDPLIFGRGGEEFDYLHSRFVEVEIIPGISAVFGAAASQAISLTHRKYASSFTISAAQNSNSIIIPKADTLAFYMGASNIQTLKKSLLENHISEDTNVAIITNATLYNETCLYTKVKDLNENAASPSIIIVGKQVENKNKFSSKKYILACGLNNPIHLEKQFEIIHQPLIKTTFIEQDINIIKEEINKANYIIFTSKHTVKYFFQSLHHHQIDGRILFSKKIVSIGKTTSAALKEKGILADMEPLIDSSTGIIDLFKLNNISSQNIFIPRSDLGLSVLPEGLKNLGNQVKTINIYQTKTNHLDKKVDLSFIDAIYFSSPSTIRGFLENYNEIPDNKKIITRGEQTEIHLNNYYANFDIKHV